MPREALPPYKRVAAALRDQITNGELLPGEQIPPVPRLIETYQVSRNTALRALRVLKDEGLITVEPGWGAFVAER